MLRVTLEDDGPLVLLFDQDVVRIGRTDSLADLVIEHGAVSRLHATLSVDRARATVSIVDAGSANGTHLNGAAIDTERVVGRDDEIRIGGVTLRARLDPDEITGVTDARERAFLDALRHAPGDEGTRFVYADWLEENGKPEQASYLRATVAAHAAKRSPEELEIARARLVASAECVDLVWRATVAMALVECPTAGSCPAGGWDRKFPTANPLVRICADCMKGVLYCPSAGDARGEAEEGRAVAIDLPTPPRRPLTRGGAHRPEVPRIRRGVNARPVRGYPVESLPRGEPRVCGTGQQEMDRIRARGDLLRRLLRAHACGPSEQLDLLTLECEAASDLDTRAARAMMSGDPMLEAEVRPGLAAETAELDVRLGGGEPDNDLERLSFARDQARRGFLAYVTGDFAHSEVSYQRALAVLERLWGVDHVACVECMDEYATLLLRLGRTGAAEALIERVRAISAANG